DTAVLDEAQTIKNPDSQIAKAAHQLKGQFRIALSGTPIENRLDDLWSQFQFINPGLLGTRESFREELADPISSASHQASSSLTRLRKRIQPFILRRLKKDVAPELPSKTESLLTCELSSSERELYDALFASARQEVLANLSEGESVFSALELLLRLRQACCHPALVPGQSAESSSKLELLLESLESSIQSGHRALVFSQWTSYLDLIGEKLGDAGIRFSRIDGSTRERGEIVESFQKESGSEVMLLSLKAGGVGLTLTAADHVYLMDSWWNPAVENQAIDRVHRIGQENPVFVYRLITTNTVEEKILSLQKAKLSLATQALEGVDGGTGLTRDDLLSLFEP
ncbi:MAG: DEAD/DEAH box helicase, partial [Proteobacteria bacterium]